MISALIGTLLPGTVLNVIFFQTGALGWALIAAGCAGYAASSNVDLSFQRGLVHAPYSTHTAEHGRTCLSQGDLLEVKVFENDMLDGEYVIAADGTLALPYLRAIPALGRSAAQVAADVSRQLAEDFYAFAPRVSVRRIAKGAGRDGVCE